MSVARRVTCGEFLRGARLRHDLGQAELASRAGMDQPAVSRIERDVVSPSLETLNRLIEAMGETIMLSTMRLSDPVPGGSNQTLGEVLADPRDDRVDLRGERLDPPPPVASKQKDVRYFHIHEDDKLDEARFAAWVKQASKLPGEKM